VDADRDAAGGGATDGVNGLCMGVAPVDASQGGVIDGFHAVLDEDGVGLVELGKVTEQGLGHTVGPCADDEADDVGNGEGLLVARLECGEDGVGVGVCLEVGEVFHGGVFAGEELLAFLQLLGNGLGGGAVGGVEGLVVAVGAAARAYRAVAVGAGEACVDGYFLGLAAQEAGEPGAIFVVAG